MDKEHEAPEEKKPKEHFPLFKSMEDAVAYCHQTGDNYYVTVFMMETWIGGLITENVRRYADERPGERKMQQGDAFRNPNFRYLFEECQDDKELRHFLRCLFRFAQEDDNFASLVLLAFGLYSTESKIDPTFDFLSIRPCPEAANQMRQCIKRFCDWLDCCLHWHSHFLSYDAPGSFFPGDPEARHLHALGRAQANLPRRSSYDQAFWHWNHETALKESTDPRKWGKFLAAGIGDQKKRTHTHPMIDDSIITFWPLVKRFNWSYNDLLNALEKALPNYEGRYPCDHFTSVQKHCAQVLGLKKGTGAGPGPRGKTGRGGNALWTPPPGFEIAQALIDARNANRLAKGM